MPAGRPSKYPKGKDLKRLMDDILNHAKQGKSLVQISARVDIPRSTMQSWAEEYSEFSAVLTRAKELEQAWWEDVGQQDKLNGLHPVAWKKSVEARFRKDYTVAKDVNLGGQEGNPVNVQVTFSDETD